MTTPATPRKPTILVAEDEAIVARDIRMLLLGLGYEPVARAASAEEAVLLAKQWRPDLVLMDIKLASGRRSHLPVGQGLDPVQDIGSDGIAAAMQIREQLFLPVVFLTAYSGGETLTRAKLAEPFGYISKPFNERELHTAIEIALYKHQIESERKRADEALRQTKQLLHSVVENIPAMVFVKSAADLRFELLNRAAETLLGLPREHMLGKTDHDLFPPEQADAFTAEDRRVMRSGQMAEIAVEPIRGANGDTRFLQTKKVLLRDSAGAAVHLLGISQDITEQKQASEALQVAKEEAERANRAKSQFLSSMSHELRTPMNAVLGFSEMLKMETVSPLPKRQAEYVEQILHAGSHLMSLINDVLDLASVEAGRLAVQLKAVPVGALVDECLVMLGNAAAQRHIRFCVRLPEIAHTEVWVDRTRLRQVLLNLLSNAIKYGPEHSVVEVRGAPETSALRIDIVDQGPGLSTEQQGRLFQLFERLDAAQGNVPGTGIGLALSKRLVEAMRGEMGVSSTLGEGSTFWLRLPLAV